MRPHSLGQTSVFDASGKKIDTFGGSAKVPRIQP